ncbi:MAG TPA: hypothetical protein VMB50_13140 [Myxococcales bacterium]|nr:hypothetical protein [Myxococcales bacterium]
MVSPPRRCAAALLLCLAACPRLEAPAEPPQLPLPAVTRVDPGDPLREPAELHLAHVRQISFGGRAGPPLFTEGGKRLAFLVWAPDGGAVVPHLLDLPSGRELPVASLPAGGSPADLWLSRQGEPCLDLRAACPEGAPCPVSRSVPLAAVGDPAGAAAGCAPPRFPLPIAGGCATDAAGDWACPLVGPSTGPRLWLWPARAASPRDLGPASARDGQPPAFSPDGRRLAWTEPAPAQADAPGTSAIAVASLVDGRIEELGPPDQSDRHPAWFPDGHGLLFDSNADDAAGRDVDVFRMGDDGQELERLTFAPGADVAPAISSDGRRLAWVSERNAAVAGERDVFVADWAE